MISSYGTEKIRSFLLFSCKRCFIISPYYHVTGLQEEQDYRSAKSDFVFLEDDDDEKTTVHYRYRRYGFCIISKLDSPHLLYQDRRYRANRRRKQSSVGACSDGDFGYYGDHRTVFYRRMEDGGILTREFGTEGDAQDISAMFRLLT
jgi:hypothetical protein